MCRITVDGEVKQFSCKMDIPLHLWDVKNNNAFIARRTHRNCESSIGAHEHKNHADIRKNHRQNGNFVVQAGGYGKEYLPSYLTTLMKEERNIITIDEYGNISLPTDIGATAMAEWEICELFGVIAPTVRARIKTLCKSGVLNGYGIKRIIRISNKYSAEVYNLETITALAFRIESFGTTKFRKALLERIMHGQKKNNTIFLSLNVGSQAVVLSYKSCRIDVLKLLNQYVSTSLIARNA